MADEIIIQSLAVTSAPTVNSATPTLFPEMNESFYLEKTYPVLITFSASFASGSNGHGAIFDIRIDGQPDLEMRRESLAQNLSYATVSSQKVVYLCEGNHTVEAWWYTDGTSTATALGIARSLTIIIMTGGN